MRSDCASHPSGPRAGDRFSLFIPKKSGARKGLSIRVERLRAAPRVFAGHGDAAPEHDGFLRLVGLRAAEERNAPLNERQGFVPGSRIVQSPRHAGETLSVERAAPGVFGFEFAHQADDFLPNGVGMSAGAREKRLDFAVDRLFAPGGIGSGLSPETERAVAVARLFRPACGFRELPGFEGRFVGERPKGFGIASPFGKVFGLGDGYVRAQRASEIAHRLNSFGVRRPGTGGKFGKKIFGQGERLFRLIRASAIERLGVAPFGAGVGRGPAKHRLPQAVNFGRLAAGPKRTRKPPRRPGIGFARSKHPTERRDVLGRGRLEEIPFGVDGRRKVFGRRLQGVAVNPRDAAREHRAVGCLGIVRERHGFFESAKSLGPVTPAQRNVRESRVGEGPFRVDGDRFAVGGFGLRELTALQKRVSSVAGEPVAPFGDGVAPALRARVVGTLGVKTFERCNAFGAGGALVDGLERPVERLFKGFVGQASLSALRDENRFRPAKGVEQRLSFGAARVSSKQHVGVFELKRRLRRRAVKKLLEFTGGLFVSSRDGEKAHCGVGLRKVAPRHSLERAGVAAGLRFGRGAEFLQKRGDFRLILLFGDAVTEEMPKIVELKFRVVGRHAQEPPERIALHGRVVGASRRLDLARKPARLNACAVGGAERVGRVKRRQRRCQGGEGLRGRHDRSPERIGRRSRPSRSNAKRASSKPSPKSVSMLL